MEFYISALCVLLLLSISTRAEADFPSVRALLHDSAVLPCSERCSGLVRWTVFSERSDILAECDQTSCRSVKEGYQMIYNQYLQGDFSLIITKADFSKRGYYTCECDRRDVCDVRLQIETLETPVEIKSGDSLVMELEVSDPVEVIYHSTGAADESRDQICTVTGGSLQCKPKYKHITSLVLELRDMKKSDSGVYVIRNTKNKEDIHIYAVTVGDEKLQNFLVSRPVNQIKSSRRSVPKMNTNEHTDEFPNPVCERQGERGAPITVPVQG